MDFIVADLVEQHSRSSPTAAQDRHKVVQALTRFGRDRPIAERADRGAVVVYLALGRVSQPTGAAVPAIPLSLQAR